MKKYLMTFLALTLAVGSLMAKPVDVNKAKVAGQMFAQATLGISGADLELVYTVNTERGDAGLYVFNVGNDGFVVVSADDNFRPIAGYSSEGIFDANNISPEFLFYMKSFVGGRSQAKQADYQAAEEWRSVMNYGRTLSYNNGKGVDYLVQSKWNQSPAPFNSMCPADANAPGGHAYTGCVATAMAQLMNYWKYPTQGQGSHSYYCNPNPPGYPGHLEYGQQSANFGATTYDWDNMLDIYDVGNYTTAQGTAVATISYHCGVAVDMMYGNYSDNGSGAFTEDVPNAIKNYFRYSTAAAITNYTYNLESWKNILKEQFDLGWPVYYAGQSSEGGHAFICDGYNDSDYFHFNWGWGGFEDDWFLIGDIDYQSSVRIITNFVPTDVYANTAQAPTNITAVRASDVAQEATISWTNPTKMLNNSNITAIDQIAVARNGRVIYTVDNPTPGANMSFVDSDVPCYSTFEYKVYAIVGGVNGKAGSAFESFGPTCQWHIVATASAFQGWKGGKIVAYDGAGREITTMTMTSNNPANVALDLTLGRVSFGWMPGSDTNYNLSIKIKDPAGNTVYEFPQGSAANMPEGVFYTGNNGCGNPAPTDAPGELFATADGDNVVLTWNSPAKTDYGINIYRDGYLCGLSQTNEFVDVAPVRGGHCYEICFLTDGGESPVSNEACANVGEGCDTGSDLWFEHQSNMKPIITWQLPENAEGLSGFYIYRKPEGGEYQRIKIVSANKTQYKDTNALEDGMFYYYKVIPYYKNIDCYAAPIKARYGNQYYVQFQYNSPTGVDESAAGMSLYPNPTKESFTVEAENLRSVEVYNMVGQVVYRNVCDGNATVVELGNVESGIYMVKVVTANGEFVQKVSVVK